MDKITSNLNEWPRNIVDSLFLLCKTKGQYINIHLCKLDTLENYYKHIDEALNLICEKWRVLLEQRFKDKLIYAQIGISHGYTRERARQCINKALVELNDILHRLRVRDNGYSSDDYVWELPVNRKTRNALCKAGFITESEIIAVSKDELM